MWAVVAMLLVAHAADYNAEGRKALEANDYAGAARSFAQAVAADPQDYTAHFHLALADSFLDKDDEAIAEYRKTLELKPGLYEAGLNLGIVLLRQKRAQEAVPVLQQAVAAKGREYRPRFYLAEALAAAGDPQQAEEHYRTAVEINPKSAEAELGLGRALARRNQLADAAPHFRKAAELDPRFQDALLELGELYEKTGERSAAVEIYQQFPGNAAAQERLGQLLLDGKHYGEAAERLEQAFQKDPTPANRLALAEAYLFNKKVEKAMPLLEQSVRAEPGNYDLRMILGRALRDGKRYPGAAQQFFEAAKIKPDSRQAWNDLAAMLYLTGNYPECVGALDRALKLGEDTPANHYFRAITLDKLRDLKGALASYQRFLELSHGRSPDEEFKARQRVRIIQKELSRR